MKNVGIRFHDGTEVAYYGSVRIQTGTDELMRILTPGNEIIAQFLRTDVKELFEVNLDEQTIDHPEAKAASHAPGQPDLFGQADGVGADRKSYPS
jgi:hypothetical protein